LAQLGFFGASDKQDVTTGGQYSLGVVEQSSSTPKVLRVARGTTGWYFYLEYRQPYGTYFDNFGPTDPAVNGVTIRMGYDYSSVTQSQLLDTTPGTAAYSDSPLGVGRSVTDPVTNISFTNVSESSTGAVVNVSFGADTVKPTPPGNLQGNPTSGTSVSLTWTASSDNVGVSGYRVYRNGGATPIATTTSTGYADSGLSPQTTYSYSVVAYDAQNNVSDPSTVSVTTPLVDTTPPSAPGHVELHQDEQRTIHADLGGIVGQRSGGGLQGVPKQRASGLAWREHPHLHRPAAKGHHELLRRGLRHIEQRWARLQHGHRGHHEDPGEVAGPSSSPRSTVLWDRFSRSM
jgi:Fibronectin type III domain